jgi:uncharacterized membrane protein YbhN (UPF0104 family)
MTRPQRPDQATAADSVTAKGAPGVQLAAISALAIALSAIAVVAIALATGAGEVERVFDHLYPGWIGLCVAASLLVYPAYTVAYVALVAATGVRATRMGPAWRTVLAGFGAFSIGGGFRVDLQALRALDGDEQLARVQVLAMGALEWALLAPLACVASIVLLAQGAAGLSALLWPWATAVPVGFAVALWITVPDRAARLSREGRPGRHWLLRVSEGVEVLRTLARKPRQYARAWLGISLYWTADITILYGALRACGVELGLGRLIVAYATGYVATRRSLPLGGAGVTEALMTFALYWVHVPIAPALAAVVIYRGFNFFVVAAPGVISYRWLSKLPRDSGTDDRERQLRTTPNR